MRIGKIGAPDIFMEVSRRVELHCMFPSGRIVSVGDSVPVEWFGYPPTCSFLNLDHEGHFICVADNRFIGIWDKAIFPTFDARTGKMIFDEDGDEADLVHEFFDWQGAKK